MSVGRYRFFSSFLAYTTRSSRRGAIPSLSRFLLPTYNRRYSNSTSTSLDWSPPARVADIFDLRDLTNECDADKQHWLVVMDLTGFEFQTEQALFNYYIEALASVLQSEEEAKKKIYCVSCGPLFGFGVELDEETSDELYDKPCVLDILDDVNYVHRKGGLRDLVGARFTPTNWNHRIDDIFSYHHLSECNSAWNSDHWLVHIRSLDGAFSTRQLVVDSCIRLLTEVVGSENDAMKKIYSVWCKIPFGFGAEIDEETLKRLKALPDVLLVLPDFSFDVKIKDQALVISLSPHLKSDSTYYNYQPSKVLSHEDSGESLDEPLRESVQPLVCSTEMSHHLRLDNVFSYHHLSERNSEWNFDHWLVIIMQRENGFPSVAHTLDFFIKILAEAIGSEQEAKEKIYIIWSSFPLGFGAEIDEETANKLKGYPNVLKVLPDYAFDVKDKVTGALVISRSQKTIFHYYQQTCMKMINRVDWCGPEYYDC